ncbi:MAG: hypothetical protein V3V08_19855 [Nannocystaceae bacterium]
MIYEDNEVEPMGAADSFITLGSLWAGGRLSTADERNLDAAVSRHVTLR